MYEILNAFSLQIYCCLGALAIADSLHYVNADMLGWWLCERQLPSGGLNGEFERMAGFCLEVLSSNRHLCDEGTVVGAK